MATISNSGSVKNLNKNSITISSTFHKTVCLQDWWLIRAERDFNGRRLAIGGLTLREPRAMRVFSSAPIVKRCDLFSLETADGITVLIKGSINKFRSHENGFSSEVCSHFLLGFPYYWETYADQCYGKESTTTGIPRSMPGFDEGLDGSAVTKTLDDLVSTPCVSEDGVQRKNIHTEVLEKSRGHHLEISAVTISAELISSSPLPVGFSLTEEALCINKMPKSEQKHEDDDKGLLRVTNKETKEISSELANLNHNGFNGLASEEQKKMSLQVESENAINDTPMVQVKIEIVNSSFAESRNGQDGVETFSGFKTKSASLIPSVSQDYEAHMALAHDVEEIFRDGTYSRSKRLDSSNDSRSDDNKTKASLTSVGSEDLINVSKDESNKDASVSIYSDEKSVRQCEIKMAHSVGISSDHANTFPKNKVIVKKRTGGRPPRRKISNIHYVSSSEDFDAVIGISVEEKLGHGYGVGVEGITDDIEGNVGMDTVNITGATTRTSNSLRKSKRKRRRSPCYV